MHSVRPQPAGLGIRSRRHLLGLALSAHLLGLPVAQAGSAGETWRFSTVDGVEIFAEHTAPSDPAPGEPPPLLVLLHLAGGDARGEYGPIVPRLLAQGYATLQVDLRSGGDRFGTPNRTVEAAGGRQWTYCEAEPDLDAVLDEINRRGGASRVLLWGSSFSAALAVRVGARRAKEVAAVVAFSPAAGGPMEDCSARELWHQPGLPLLVARPTSELAHPSVAEQWARLEDEGVRRFSAAGSHGSSMLVTERGSADAESTWRELADFLEDAFPPPGSRREIASSGLTLSADLLPPLTEPPWPAVLLLHSAGSDRSAMTDLATRLAAAGIASLRVDLRGHGESLGLGRFEPQRWEETGQLVREAWRDVASSLEALAAEPGVVAGSFAVVASSYSVEAAARADRERDRVAAWVALSPGDLSEESMAWAGERARPWWFLRAERERPFFDDLFAAIEATVPQGEISVLSGGGHGDGLLVRHPGLDRRIARWLTRALETGRVEAEVSPPRR